MPVTNITLYRGTNELWEQAVIEANLPPPNITLITGNYLVQSARIMPQLENQIRARIQSKPCSMLRSGKEIVIGIPPLPLNQLNAQQINEEIVKRVGAETALGTPNYFSHFIPCGINSGISANFGGGAYYKFQVQGVRYGKTKQEIERYVAERNNLASYAVPLFEGGNSEVLAYTGSLITSVVMMQGQALAYTVLNSLD